MGNYLAMTSCIYLKKIDDLLDLVELRPKKNTPLRYFSKGMLQRIGLAQALINDPDLVVLDEPMSGLDPLGRARVRDIILQLRNRGKTILFSSHILSDVETICSRIGIISKGKLRETGTIDSLLKNNIKEIEIVAVDLNSEEIQNIKEIGAKVVSLSGTIMITAPDPIKRDAILSIVSAKNGRLQSVENLRETLEDLFMKKYGASSS